MTVNEKQEYSVFTVCNLAYLPKALVVADSLSKYSNTKLKIYLFDRKIPADFSEVWADIFWIEDMGIPNLYQLAFKYDIIELSTSLKPYLTLKLLEKYRKVIYFDPDICLFDSITPILSDLDDHSLVLTPHYTTPLSNHRKPGWDCDIGMMRFGSFNLGFYAVTNSSQGLNFLRWWSDRCIRFNFMETQFGLSTDQKWVSIAPCLFEDLYVSFNMGYNAAPWNIFERSIVKKEKERGYIVNEKYPLIFFHFSNFDEADPGYLKEQSLFKTDVNCPALLELGMTYKKLLSKKETIKVASTLYGFDYMSGGEYISMTLRRAYACILNELPLNHDPFNSDGLVGDFARKNYLFGKKTKENPKKPIGLQNIEGHRNKFKYIYFVMRLILRLIGPNKFHNLSRLLVYLSSYRQNRGLWKY